MKIASYLILLLAVISCQRNKDVNPKAFQLLEGKWEQIGHQTNVDGKGAWVIDSTNGSIDLIIRTDGVPLDKYGKGFCCSPKNFLVGGIIQELIPDSTYRISPGCAAVSCRGCETVELQVTEYSLLWIDCNGDNTRYRRLS